MDGAIIYSLERLNAEVSGTNTFIMRGREIVMSEWSFYSGHPVCKKHLSIKEAPSPRDR